MRRSARSARCLAALVVSALALTLATTVPAAALGTCTGRCRDITVPLPAGVKVTSNAVRLLVPFGYSTSTARYPVIYLLCGAGGNQTEWTVSSNIANYTATMQAIFVMPDCGGAVNRPGWYSDWVTGEFQWETYYIDVVMPYIASHYRTIPGANGIAGLSMGGYGALALAARHRGLFKTVGSFGGLPDIQYPNYSMVNAGIMPAAIWGKETTNAANWTAHNPTALAANLAGASLYLACGTGGTTSDAANEERLSAIDHGPFLDALAAAGVPYHPAFFSGGEHTWPYFSAEAAWALPHMLIDLSQ
ncbi:MAG: hypothetical protein DLM58_10715 [Pseudonocardiales bacterium]|nr:MAG: hypothetical protein DLM58_10715 [Pseudonocardiales bacterium]